MEKLFLSSFFSCDELNIIYKINQLSLKKYKVKFVLDEKYIEGLDEEPKSSNLPPKNYPNLNPKYTFDTVLSFPAMNWISSIRSISTFLYLFLNSSFLSSFTTVIHAHDKIVKDIQVNEEIKSKIDKIILDLKG